MLTFIVPSPEYPTIDSALVHIPPGGAGVIELAPGVYRGNWTVKDGREVTVFGSGQDKTFLDGQEKGSVFDVTSASLHISDLTVQNGRTDNSGGGMRYIKASGTLKNVSFTDNTAMYGGGVYLFGSSPTFDQVTFTDNKADSGGGMYMWYSFPTLTHVTFDGNTATRANYYGDGGGGMNIDESSPTLNHVTFTRNTAVFGGGIHLFKSSTILNNVSFTENRADYGGGVAMYESSPTLTEVSFIKNKANQIRIDNYSKPVLVNVTGLKRKINENYSTKS